MPQMPWPRRSRTPAQGSKRANACPDHCQKSKNSAGLLGHNAIFVGVHCLAERELGAGYAAICSLNLAVPGRKLRQLPAAPGAWEAETRSNNAGPAQVGLLLRGFGSLGSPRCLLRGCLGGFSSPGRLRRICFQGRLSQRQQGRLCLVCFESLPAPSSWRGRWGWGPAKNEKDLKRYQTVSSCALRHASPPGSSQTPSLLWTPAASRMMGPLQDQMGQQPLPRAIAVILLFP